MALPPVQSLKKVLQSWNLEDLIEGGLGAMSESIECRVAPSFGEDEHEHMASFVANGRPVFAPPSHASRVIKAVPGGDGLAWIQDERWNSMPKPKVAMVSGWGRPGTAVDAVNDRDLALVGSFSEVLSDPRCLNLQMFHRESDAEAADPTEPPLPILPDLLDWPCPELFGRGDGGSGRDSGNGPGGAFSAVRVDR